MARCWLAALALATPTAQVRAEPGPEAVRFDYSAPAECPDAATFAARVRERTSRGRLAERDELARTFTVALSADADGYRGSIEFLDDAAAPASRRVHGEQCDAVVSSLALIAALALDSALPSGDSEPEPPALTPPAAAPVADPPPPAPRAPTEPSAPSKAKPRALEAARLGLLGGYGTALAAPRLGVLAELGWRSHVALRLTAHYDWHEARVNAERRAKLRQQGVEVSFCSRHLRWSAWVVAPCLAVDLGSLRAAGVPSSQLTSVRAETIWWAALGGQLAVAFEPDVPFWVELRAAGELPLRAGYQFTFDEPRGVAYEVPRFSGSFALASGVRFR